MKTLILGAAIGFAAFTSAQAGQTVAHQQETAIRSPADGGIPAAFDILAAHAHRDGNTVTFHMTTNGTAGADIPPAKGTLAGAPVWSYVWPTSLNPLTVGFAGDSGILALAATSHPDFDDTPLFDENGDGDPGNDGTKWHSHWLVLSGSEGCGNGQLGVRNIARGTSPAMPATWPGLPVYLDSPGFTPLFDGAEITVNVGFSPDVALADVAYDGVTAALRVNANLHAPLLCVTDVFDLASGDLSLPGKL